ncbi:MAG: hypothetical protein NVS2B4_08510 [Ramlibacter sp.]
MTENARWIAAGLTLAVLVLYEVWFALAQRSRPQELARSAHASLREDWFDAVSQQPGSEVLAVQTLRNSLMSASMTASTAVLGLMGTVTLSASSLNASFSSGGARQFDFTPRLALELILLALLFASLVSSVMAVRYYNHAGFVGAMPVGSQARRHWHAIGRSHLRRAGILYSWSLRNLVLVVPAVAFILHPVAGPVTAVVVVTVLFVFDRVQADA